MTLRLRMFLLRDDPTGTWIPLFMCDGCLSPVHEDGRAMWNADSPDRHGDESLVAAGFVVVCGARCEQRIRQRVQDVRNWSTQPISRILAGLAVTTRTTSAVVEAIEDMELRAFEQRLSTVIEQATKERTATDGETA